MAAIEGTGASETLTGGAGDDSINGGAGDDTLIAGTGVDTVDGGAGDDQLVLLGLFGSPDYIPQIVDGTTVRVTNAVTGEDITASNVETVKFADGTVKTMLQLRELVAGQANQAPVFANSPPGSFMSYNPDGNDSGRQVVALADGSYALIGSIGSLGQALQTWHFNTDGTLDRDYAGFGVVTTQIGPFFEPREALQQADGKLVVSGWELKSGNNYEWALLRFNADGTLDTSFGNAGRVETVLSPIGADDRVRSIVQTADGKIIAAGHVMTTGNNGTGDFRDFVLVRYNADGTIDTTFGVNGKVVQSLGPTSDIICSIKLTDDGHILAWGTQQNPGTGAVSVVLARYDADGNLDTSFGTDGMTITPIHDGSSNAASRSIAIQGDGKIIALGQEDAGRGDGSTTIFVQRYNTDGTLDATFNGDGNADGKITIAIGEYTDIAYNAVIQADGKIVLAGLSFYDPGHNHGMLVRLNADGSLDTGFGNGGIVWSPFPTPADDGFDGVSIDSSGNLVVAAFRGVNDDLSKYDTVLLRYTSEGQLDTTFNPQDPLADKNLAAASGPAVDLLWGHGAVYDAELGARDNYAGATLTVERHGGAVSTDVFAADDDNLSFAGGAVTLEGLQIGTVLANANGTLSIQLNSNASQLWVNALTNLITWQNSSVSAGTTVQFDWTFDDGSGAANSSVTSTSSITVVAGIDGTGGNDSLAGTGGDDVIRGQSGNDTIDGQGGDDLVYGNSGNDTIIGGAGNDTLVGNDGADTFRPGAGDDSIDGGDITDRIGYTDRNVLTYKADATTGVSIDLTGITGDGRFGSGLVHDGQGGIDTVTNVNFIVGSNFDDTIVGSGAAIFEQFEGGTGNDYIDGGALRDTLNNADNNRAVFASASSAETIDLAAGTATGGDGNDVLVNITQARGSQFGDHIYGSNRTDYTEQFEGQGGNDTIDGRGGNDIVRYDNAPGAVNVNLAAGTASDGQGGADTLLNIEGVQGSSFGDVLAGGNPANGVSINDGLIEIFRGGGGNDTIDGGQGYDRADYNNTATTGVNVTLGGTGTGTAQDGQGGVDTLLNIEAVRGSAFGDTLTGSDSAPFESFEGREGNDIIDGKGGTDRADYSSSTGGVNVDLASGIAQDGWGGTDTLLNIENVRGSRDFDDTIAGNGANNSIEGLGGADSLGGNDGNDTLNGGAGDDTLAGGNGNDWADYSAAGGAVTVNLATGSSSGAAGNDVLSGIEAVQGSQFGDALTGGSGDETFVGGGGNDAIDGGTGTDTVGYWSAGTGVNVNLSTGVATGAGVGTDTLSNIENATGSSFDDTLVGTAGDNNLNGGLGNDSIDGGAGTNDWTNYYDAASGVNANMSTQRASGGGGNDTLVGIENVGGSSFNDTIAGDGGSNALRGEAGNDTIDGGAGNDYITGGSGNDSLIGNTGIDTADYFYSDASAGVNVNLATGVATGGGGNDTLSGIENVNATNFNDTITGDLNANFLQGEGGNDSINAAAGDDLVDAGWGTDTVDGGTGADTLVVHAGMSAYTVSQNGTDMHLVNAGTGEDITIRNVEQVQFTDGTRTLAQIVAAQTADLTLVGTSAADTLTGGAGNDNISGLASSDSLVGNAGNDTLDGGGGADTLVGGAGNDTYVIDQSTDMVNETAPGSGGWDTVQVKLTTGTYTLAANVEQAVVASTAAVGLTGNDLNNWLEGNAAANALTGGKGVDTLLGGAGNDVINGGDDSDVVQGGAGNDTLDGGVVKDKINLADGNTLDYSDDPGAVNINMATGTVIDGWGNTDKVSNFQFVFGSFFNDTITGSSGTGFEMFEGLGGDDTIDGGAIADKINANDSNRINYTYASGGVTVDLHVVDGWQHASGAAGSDLLRNFNQVRGSDFDDAIYGSDRTDVSELFEARGGDNTIDGGGGIDLVRYEGAVMLDTVTGAGVYVNLVDGVGTSMYRDVNGQLVAGSDTLLNIEGVQGSRFNDTLIGGNAANGTAWNDGLIEIFRGGAGNDDIDGGQGWDRVDYTSSATGVNVNLATGSASDGLGGTDTLVNIEAVRGSDFGDVLTGSGADIESFEGRAGNDTIDGGDGRDRADYISSAAGANINLALGTASDGWGGTDTLSNIENARGSQFNDTITGTAIDNVIEAAGGNDSVNAGDGDDTIDAGVGADTVDGGAGSDTLVLRGAYGAYGITRPASAPAALLLTNATTGESIMVSNVEAFQFTDGVKTLADVQAKVLTAGNDVYSGTAGDDSIDGLAGNDSLSGLEGSDTIIGGQGNDTMVGGSGDDLYVVDSASDVIVENPGEGMDSVNVAFTVAGLYAMADNVENATVTSGSTVAVNVTGNALDNSITGSAAANSLVGAAGNDMLDGGLGNDTLAGGAGDDTYVINVATDVINETVTGSGGVDTVKLMFTTAGAYTLAAGVENAFIGNPTAVTITGNDLANTITGNAANNVLNGGLGNDTLAGGTATGTGDTLDGGAGDDTVNMLAAWSADYQATRATSTDTKIVNAVTGEVVILRNVDFVHFADDTVKTMSDLWGNTATALPDSLVGTDAGESINGLAGNDTITGLGGNDTMDGGADTDSLVGGSGDDTYVVNAVADVVVENPGEGMDTVNVALGVAGVYTLSANVENGTVTSTSTLAIGITGNALDNKLTGNGAANSLTGGLGNDTLDGGAGTDTLVGGAGDDVYYLSATTDVVNETVTGSGGNDTVNLVFAGATTYTLGASVENGIVANGTAGVNITGNGLANGIVGNAANNTLVGGDGNDTIYGGGGTDSIDGGLGAADVLVLTGVATDYQISRPAATTTVFAKGGVQVTASGIEFVQFDNGTFAYNDVVAQVGSVGNDSLAGGSGDDSLDGGGGNDSVSGLGGDDSLFGGAGADTIVGGTGTDWLDGGDGSDVYVHDAGDGDDFIQQNDTASADVDVLRLTQPGLTADDVSFTRGYFSYDDLVVNIAQASGEDATVDQVVVLNFFANDAVSTGTIDQIVITGRTFTQADMAAQALVTGDGDHVYAGYNTADNIASNSNNDDWISAGGGNDTVDAGVGNDIVFGGSGNDVLNGGGDNDTIAGGAGNDTLAGGAGDDVLSGGSGSDTYLFDATSGNDVISESLPALAPEQLASGIGPVYIVSDGDAPLSADTDTLSIGTAAANVHVTRSGDDLVLTLQATGNSVTVQKYFANGVSTIEKVMFSDGTSWSATTIRARVLVATDGDDSITGYLGGDKLGGGDGNDVLDGREGNDTLTGGAGDDTLTGGLGSDRFVLDQTPGSGVDTITDFASNVDTILLKGSVFTGLGSVGQRIGVGDKLSYDADSGELVYDADGAGGASGVVVAILGTASHPVSLGLDFVIG
jgi:uncharacterized delta-60 repeat protein